MSVRTVDVLIFIPLIPAMCWFLPWERWAIPNKILGPYLLFCAFAFWHFKQYFKQSWWLVLLYGCLGITLSAKAIFDLRKVKILKHAQQRKAKLLKQARHWPVAEGFVLHTGKSRDADGVLKVTVNYMYKVHDEEYFGSESFTSTSEDNAERFKARKLKVHYQQDKPEICVLDHNGM